MTDNCLTAEQISAIRELLEIHAGEWWTGKVAALLADNDKQREELDAAHKRIADYMARDIGKALEDNGMEKA